MTTRSSCTSISKAHRLFIVGVLLLVCVPVLAWESYRQTTAGVLPASHTREDVNRLANLARVRMQRARPDDDAVWREAETWKLIHGRDDVVDAVIDRWSQRIRDMAAIVEGNGGELVVFYFPIGTPFNEWEKRVHARAQAVSDELGVEFYDMMEVIPDRTTTYFIEDNDHMNGRSQRLIADMVASRRTDWRVSGSPQGNHEVVSGPMEPGMRKPWSLYGEPHVMQVNRQGFLHAPDLEAKTRPRVLTVGDSFVMPAGIHPDNTFQTLLTNSTNADWLSGGVGGWGIDEEVEYVKANMVNAGADVVVLCVNWSDFANCYTWMLLNRHPGIPSEFYVEMGK